MSRSAWALVLAAAALGVVFLAFALMVRSVVPKLPEPLEDLATRDARDSAHDLEASLTATVDETGDAPGWELRAAVDHALERGIPMGEHALVDELGTRSVWRAEVRAGAQRNAVVGMHDVVAAVCVTITVDPAADPRVRMVDGECLSEREGYLVVPFDSRE